MDWPIESAFKALREYKQSNNALDTSEAADSLADVVEEFLRCAAQRDPELANEVDYFFTSQVSSSVEVTIYIPDKLADEMEKILAITEGYYEPFDHDGTIETFTVKFGAVIEADIKVCNGDTPYVDPVLFENGCEVQVLDPAEDLLGTYEFEYAGVKYIAHLKRESESDVRPS